MNIDQTPAPDALTQWGYGTAMAEAGAREIARYNGDNYDAADPLMHEGWEDLAVGVLHQAFEAAQKDEATVDRMAEAMATEGDEEDCFEVLRHYVALPASQKTPYLKAHGSPTLALESCQHWRRKARAALGALA